VHLKVSEDPLETKKPAYVDFKRAVWHESMRVILEPLELHSKTGCWVMCGDGVKRLIYPVILMLSADFEEQ
jgi:hypothetical protein